MPLRPMRTITSTSTAAPLALAAMLAALAWAGTGAASTAPVAQDFAPLLVSARSTDYLDAQGQVWLADQPYTPGGWGYVDDGDSVGFDRLNANPTLDIQGTIDDPLYSTGRAFMDAYRFDLPDGVYALTLHFAETLRGNDGTGVRVFDITVNGQLAWDDFDILRHAVTPNTATTVTREPLEVFGGSLTVGFHSRTGGPTNNVPAHTAPEVSALQVRTYVPPPTPTPTPTLIPPTPTPTPPRLGSLVTPTSTGPTPTPTPAPVDGPAAVRVWLEAAPSPEGPVRVAVHLSHADGVASAAFTVRFPANALGVDPEASEAAAGLHWEVAGTGEAVLRGVFATGTAQEGAVGTLVLTPRQGVRALPVRLSVRGALVRGADGSPAQVGLGDALVAYLGLLPWADVNGDGAVDGADAAAVAAAYGTNDARADVDGDGAVGLRDLALVGVAHERYSAFRGRQGPGCGTVVAADGGLCWRRYGHGHRYVASGPQPGRGRSPHPGRSGRTSGARWPLSDADRR